VLALVLVVVSVGAFADNVRPVTIVNGSEPSLQSILNNIYGNGVINADTNQQTAGTWFLPGTPPIGTLPILYAYYAGDSDSVGLYTGGTKVGIFTGGALAGTSASIMFNTGGTITIAGDCTQVNCGTFSGIDQNLFGFYLTDNTAGGTFYTQDSLNGGTARALTYVNPLTDRWTIAFNEGSDQDFNDRVITVESIVATPEPGSVMLLGAGLMFFARKRNKKA
jgi:hypothetical protein